MAEQKKDKNKNKKKREGRPVGWACAIKFVLAKLIRPYFLLNDG